MNSDYFESNLYLNDVLKLEINEEFKLLADSVNRKLNIYFMKNYKKIRFEEFLNTNDYHIQKIRFYISTIQGLKSIDIYLLGQFLQNFLLMVEKPIMLASDYKMIKSTVSKLRSFFIKNKQQEALIHQLEIIETKSKQNHDYLLLMEKICFLLKTIFEVAKPASNLKYKLYVHVTKSFTEEKFLEERKLITKQIKIGRVKTTDDIETEFIQKLEANETKFKGIYLRSNTHDDEDEEKDDLVIENLDSIYKDEKFYSSRMSFNILNDIPIDNRNSPTLKRRPSIHINFKEFQTAETQAKALDTQNYNRLYFDKMIPSNEVSEKSDVESICSNGMQVNCKEYNDSDMTIKIVDNFELRNKIIKLGKGDTIPEEFNEEIFNDGFFRKILVDNYATEFGSKGRTSCLLLNAVKQEINIVRERSPTPVKQRKESLMVPQSPLKRAKSNERLSTLNPRKGGDSGKGVQDIFTLIPLNKKMYPVYSDSNSIIKVPERFMTDDADLKLLCDFMNESCDNKSWKKTYESKSINIHTKSVEGSPNILIKTLAVLDGFTKEEIFEAISDVRIRMQWDTIFSEFRIVETNDEQQWEVLYMSIKSPSVFVDARDFVQKRKIWKNFPNSDSDILHFKSVNHRLCPLKPKVIRADTLISGYYIRTLSLNPVRTTVAIVSQCDIKGMIPAWLVNSVAKKAPKQWLENLMKGCEKVRATKKY